MTKNVEDGGFVALITIAEQDRQMVCSQTTFGVTHQVVRLIFCAFAHHQGDHQLTVRCHRRVIPKVTRFIAFILGAVFLFFLTKLHCSSNSKARGVKSRTS